MTHVLEVVYRHHAEPVDDVCLDAEIVKRAGAAGRIGAGTDPETGERDLTFYFRHLRRAVEVYTLIVQDRSLAPKLSRVSITTRIA